jgi:hypothetical protein
MMHDSMEFLDMYRSRLKDSGGAATRLRRNRLAQSPRRRGRRLSRLCGRVLLASGHLMVTAGERLSGGAANGRAPAHG